MRLRIYVIFIVVITISASALAIAADSSAYVALTNRISVLSSSKYTRTITGGKTVTGRPIYAYAMSDFRVSSASKTRVLIISGQHGDEVNPIKAVVSFSENLAQGVYPGILSHNLVIIVPIVNPDGLANGTRLNNLGMDLNRGWQTLDTSENQYVHNIIKLFKPQLLIDAHEWFSVPDLPGNGIELAWSASSIQRKTMARIAGRVDGVAGLTQIECRRDSNPALFHRRYSRLGYAAFLLETEPNLSYTKKETAYKRAFLTAITELDSNPGMSKRISPASTGWSMARTELVIGNLKGALPKSNRNAMLAWSLGPAIGCYVLLLFIRPKKKKILLKRSWKPTRETRELRERGKTQELFSKNRYIYRT